MRILAVADEESRYLWDFYEDGKLKGIDLIISAGDLKAEYLSFLATFSNVPVLYIHGNHDDKYEIHPPEGCISVEDTIYTYKGVRILGLGGSMRYKPGNNQFTEKEMLGRVKKLRRKLKRHKGFDILLTHAPAFEINDGEDIAHHGFHIFKTLLDEYKPKFFVHGHVHKTYGRKHKQYTSYNGIHVINAYEACVFDFEEQDIEHNIRRP